jgi:hypothetical protein
MQDSPPTAGDKLLRLFDTDQVVAGEELLRCREMLVRRFAAEHCYDADNLANQTIERVVADLEKNPQRVITNIWSFISGVARNIVHEIHRSPVLKEVPLDDISPMQEPRTTPLDELLIGIAEQDNLHACLNECLEEFDAPNRQLLVSYYDAGDGEKLKQTRVRLADSLRLTSARLKKLAFNLRQKLEACIKNCLALRNKIEKPS